MNKTRKELIEIINRQLLATKPPFLRNSVYFSVSEATDLLRELEEEWISVDERLPDCNIQHGNIFASENVLVVQTNGEMSIEQYFQQGKHGIEGWSKIAEQWTGEKVTHWRNLPQPPKTEKE